MDVEVDMGVDKDVDIYTDMDMYLTSCCEITKALKSAELAVALLEKLQALQKR
jgi:hypothetical protein